MYKHAGLRQICPRTPAADLATERLTGGRRVLSADCERRERQR